MLKISRTPTTGWMSGRIAGWAISQLLALGVTAPLAPLAWAAEAAPALRTQLVGQAETRSGQSVDGVVEALRQTVVAAQVAGTIVQMDVKAGDRVKAGQVLMRIDARAAEQATQASEAQAQAARASLQLATREFERQQQLHKQQYISQAALDQAEAQYKATQAQVNAQLAQVAVARTQSGFNVVRSPYDGVIADLPVAVGDMAMPGRPLLTVYDPAALRVTAHLPQSLAAGLDVTRTLLVDIPGRGAPLPASKVQLLPAADAQSHTMELRVDLPKISGLVPGLFARVLLPGTSLSRSSNAALTVPSSAVLRRAELTAVYVLDRNGKPLLRQVRLGAPMNGDVEVLSGLNAGDRIALEPQLAARQR